FFRGFALCFQPQQFLLNFGSSEIFGGSEILGFRPWRLGFMLLCRARVFKFRKFRNISEVPVFHRKHPNGWILREGINTSSPPLLRAANHILFNTNFSPLSLTFLSTKSPLRLVR